MLDCELTPEQARVLGSLMEKEMTTPEYYPLSLNGLVNACNQKSNRNPVVAYDEEIVLDAVKEYDFPVSFDFPAGHIRDNRTLILGREISLMVKAKKAVVKFLK